MSTRVVDLVRKGGSTAPAVEGETPQARLKRELHAELVGNLDLVAVQSLSRKELESQLRTRISEMLKDRSAPMTRDEQSKAVDEIVDEVLGFGPLERLLRAPDVTDILVNGCENVWVERNGKLEEVPVRFRDDQHLLHVINRIVSAVGRRIDESNPMVDARLPDGSRFNAVIPPVAIDGPMVSIRRFGIRPIRKEDLLRLGAMPAPVMDLLEACVHSKLNILISGGTGSGKTTLLNVLSSFIPGDERIVTIEDAAELRLQQRHVVRLETRPPNLEGEGEITARALVRNSLRMRPDRIVVGEIRGEESIDMLQAMNTGHEGSLSTVHANSPRLALGRLQTMVGLSLGNMPGQAIREMVGDALDLVVQVNRLSDGKRRLVSLTEVTGVSAGVISTQQIFRFRQKTVDSAGNVRGVFEATGVRPAFSARLAANGVEPPGSTFQFSLEV